MPDAEALAASFNEIKSHHYIISFDPLPIIIGSDFTRCLNFR